jgi:hypothetical protein
MRFFSWKRRNTTKNNTDTWIKSILEKQDQPVTEEKYSQYHKNNISIISVMYGTYAAYTWEKMYKL